MKELQPAKIGPLDELQQNWSLDQLRMHNPREALIRVHVVDNAVNAPTIVGRHVKDIFSWPVILRETATAEFHFSSIYVIRLSEEHSSDEIENPQYDGTTFRRYFDSLLLRQQIDFRSEIVSASFNHYQFVFQN